MPRGLSQVRRSARLALLISGAKTWLPVVREFRPAESWDAVAARIKAALPKGRSPLTRDFLLRASRLLASEGLLAASVIERAPRQARVRMSASRSRALAFLHGLLTSRVERLTLRVLAEELTRAGHRPPGGQAWRLSSVKRLRDEAWSRRGELPVPPAH